MREDFWGCMAAAVVPTAIFTLQANEFGKLSDKLFWIAFIVQSVIFIYCVYKAKGFIWQTKEGDGKTDE